MKWIGNNFPLIANKRSKALYCISRKNEIWYKKWDFAYANLEILPKGKTLTLAPNGHIVCTWSYLFNAGFTKRRHGHSKRKKKYQNNNGKLNIAYYVDELFIFSGSCSTTLTEAASLPQLSKTWSRVGLIAKSISEGYGVDIKQLYNRWCHESLHQGDDSPRREKLGGMQGARTRFIGAIYGARFWIAIGRGF